MGTSDMCATIRALRCDAHQVLSVAITLGGKSLDIVVIFTRHAFLFAISPESSGAARRALRTR
jgi:hypothetical protein